MEYIQQHPRQGQACRVPQACPVSRSELPLGGRRREETGSVHSRFNHFSNPYNLRASHHYTIYILCKQHETVGRYGS